MATELSIREELERNMAELEGGKPESEPVSDDGELPEEKPVSEGRDERGRFKKSEGKSEIEETQPAISTEEAKPEVKQGLEAPQGWSAAMKAKFSGLEPDVQAEIIRRENDFHKMVTKHDGELRLGKELQSVINPYMAIIQAEGGTPATAVQSLLNTAYVLRTGSPTQKAQLLQQIASDYGIDMGMQPQHGQQEHNPLQYIQQLQSEINNLKGQLSPERLTQQLQEIKNDDMVRTEIQAFAANPANQHFEKVKSMMAYMLDNGVVSNLQEAYDAACYANPEIRSTMLNTQKADEAAKRKSEVEAKKKAAASITGSPSILSGNNTPPSDRTLREELEANAASLLNSRI